MNHPLLLALVIAALAAQVAVAAADEFRLKDGEVIHGQVKARKKGRIYVVTAGGVRILEERAVAEVLEGEAPHVALARQEAGLEARDADGLAALAAYAWRHRMDAEAERLARVALVINPDHVEARRLVGDHRVQERWLPAWKPAWGGAGTTGPRLGARRRAALRRGGATRATEKAVQAGLQWLAAHQDTDGKLDADGFQRHDPPGDPCDGQGGGHHGERVPCAFDGVTTSVALLAWLASGTTPVSGPYRDNTTRALDYCEAHLEEGIDDAYDVWNHSFCIQAVADAYAVTRNPELRCVLDRAVAALLARQLEDGGFSYYMRIGDVPTTGAAGTALGLAAQAGILIEARRMERMLAFLDGRIDPKTGRSEYHHGAERKNYTPTRANAAAALAVRAFLGRLEGTSHLARQIRAISDRKPVWKIEFKTVKAGDGRKVRAQIGNLYPYQWYYTTLTLFHHGGKPASTWFAGLRSALLKGQHTRGPARGSWDPKGQYSSSAGRVFVTGICTLMLQVPYRYPCR